MACLRPRQASRTYPGAGSREHRAPPQQSNPDSLIPLLQTKRHLISQFIILLCVVGKRNDDIGGVGRGDGLHLRSWGASGCGRPCLRRLRNFLGVGGGSQHRTEALPGRLLRHLPVQDLHSRLGGGRFLLRSPPKGAQSAGPGPPLAGPSFLPPSRPPPHHPLPGTLLTPFPTPPLCPSPAPVLPLTQGDGIKEQAAVAATPRCGQCHCTSPQAGGCHAQTLQPHPPKHPTGRHHQGTRIECPATALNPTPLTQGPSVPLLS